MRIAVIGTALLLGACGGAAADNATQASSPAPAAAPDCSGKPDFVAVEADAKITTCTQGDTAATGKVSGTVIYTSETPVGQVLTHAKDSALKAGLTVNIENEMTVAAAEGQRTINVMAMPQGAGSTVTVSWGRPK